MLTSYFMDSWQSWVILFLEPGLGRIWWKYTSKKESKVIPTFCCTQHELISSKGNKSKFEF